VRLEEALLLKRSHAEFIAGSINLRLGESKNDDALSIPILRALRALLQEHFASASRNVPTFVFVWIEAAGLLALRASGSLGAAHV
jgi:hypothetical protein